jgi:hypothetical protein
MQRVCGSLHLIVGCMYSGKTDELLRQIRVRRLSGKHVVLIKYAKDTRYSQRKDLVSSHNGMHLDGAVPVVGLACGEADPYIPVNTSCIAIDEGQFLEGIEDFVSHWTAIGKFHVEDGAAQRRRLLRCSSLNHRKVLTSLSRVCGRISSGILGLAWWRSVAWRRASPGSTPFAFCANPPTQPFQSASPMGRNAN